MCNFEKKKKCSENSGEEKAPIKLVWHFDYEEYRINQEYIHARKAAEMTDEKEEREWEISYRERKLKELRNLSVNFSNFYD